MFPVTKKQKPNQNEKNANSNENALNKEDIKDSTQFNYNVELAEWWRTSEKSLRKVQKPM